MPSRPTPFPSPLTTSSASSVPERLLARMNAARQLRCLLITGPAGAGKSALAAAWSDGLASQGIDVTRLTATDRHNDPLHFLQALRSCIAPQAPAATQNASRAAAGMDADPDAMERLAVLLVRDISARQRRLVCVLDDVQQLTSAATLDALQWLLDHAPAQLQWVLVARGMPRLSLDRLRSQAQLLELNQQDLCFTAAESAQFIQSQCALADPGQVRRLHERTQGWVHGLQLLTREPPADTSLSTAGTAQVLARYFDKEVLAPLRADELELLVHAAPCKRFCAALCAALVDTPQAVDGIAALLHRLERGDHFVVRVDDPSTGHWYRFHPLLRESLLARFAHFPEPQQQTVHGRAFAWFQGQGLPQETEHHAMRSGQAEQAALIEQCAQSLLARGERRELMDLLKELAPSNVNLQLWQARMQFFERKLDECAGSLDALQRLLPEDAVCQRFQVTVLQGALALQLDDTDAARAIMPRLRMVPSDADPFSVGSRHNILSWMYIQQGEYAMARSVQREAAPLVMNGAPLLATASGSLQGRSLVGLSYAMEGKMPQAERVLRAVVAQAAQAGKACSDARYLALSLLADVLFELDHIPQACALVEDKLEVLERTVMPDAMLRVYRVLAAAAWQSGQPAQTFSQLQRLKAYATHHRLERLLAHGLADTVHYHLLLQEPDAARSAMAQLQAMDKRQASDGAISEIAQAAQSASIQWALGTGDLEGAADRLAQLLASCEAAGRQRSVTHLLVRSAALDSLRGHGDAARLQLVEALRRGHRLGLLRSLVDADPMARALLQKLGTTEPLDPVLAFYVERLLATSSPTQAQACGAAAPPTSALQSLSEREMDMLRLLAQAMPNKKMARALELSPETVKWYLSRIYAKLGVSGRQEAVARARDLGWSSEATAP
ncbi:LuxR C-terminal-related transcriptional regulator [Acidovorax bellezanensis]|uniref:LuxR C-terminal-related transcriptional regulator n=1 Tax=Acidovorax bellezanensis TaxID=2976702 RepID=UPI0021C20F2A|nr:LuxR C-terminal-related transcriptional regulator [Acidovorax sp. Be4]